jgi:hypothetical protein
MSGFMEDAAFRFQYTQDIDTFNNSWLFSEHRPLYKKLRRELGDMPIYGEEFPTDDGIIAHKAITEIEREDDSFIAKKLRVLIDVIHTKGSIQDISEFSQFIQSYRRNNTLTIPEIKKLNSLYLKLTRK